MTNPASKEPSADGVVSKTIKLPVTPSVIALHKEADEKLSAFKVLMARMSNADENK